MQIRVLVELRAPSERRALAPGALAAGLAIPTFQIDPTYAPVPTRSSSPPGPALRAGGEEAIIVRGTIEEARIRELEALPEVIKVWRDTRIAPFARHEIVRMVPSQAYGDCSIPPCDCAPGTPKGTISDVARFLEVDQVWAAGHRGKGIVVGVVDGGITAEGRAVSSADTTDAGWPGKLIPRVIGGWPQEDWGTTGVSWGWHGNMCATDVLGMAPDAQIYDLRIAGENSISSALAAFQWALEQHRADGTPHILTNSWGIFQESWDPEYARNAEHPFTRKVVEVLNQGILVLFAAGNCGESCPDARCGYFDIGPGRSIWGANGHPRVITVGAVNVQGQISGYSSQGPAALDPQKPDFCAATHFTGFFESDSGTSAATPIAAGVLALLKGAFPTLTQDRAKEVLTAKARDIGPPGRDPHSGAGILRAHASFNVLDRTAEQAEGQITSLHLLLDGAGWGPPEDHLEVDVLVRLDTQPERVFGLALREASTQAVRQSTLDLLRDAFEQQLPVEIDYEIGTGKSNGEIVGVRLTRRPGLGDPTAGSNTVEV